jgi:hypothetical protein
VGGTAVGGTAVGGTAVGGTAVGGTVVAAGAHAAKMATIKRAIKAVRIPIFSLFFIYISPFKSISSL